MDQIDRLSAPAPRLAWLAFPTLLCALLPLAGCPGQISSPDAALDTVAPQVVCGAQQATPVTLNGHGFTPLPIDTLTGQAKILLPKVHLAQRSLLDGSAGNGRDVLLEDDATLGHVRWLSEQEMSIDIYPELLSSPSGVTPGVYDVTVQNPDGRLAAQPSALAVIAPPRLQGAVPSPACGAQGAVSYTLTGANFVTLNGTLPSVSFTALSATTPALTLTPTSATGCVTQTAPAGIQLAACTGLIVSLPQGALDPGSYRVAVRNPKEAGCVTQEDVRVAVVPPPAVDQILSAAICTAQAASTVILSGSGFLSLGSQPDQNPTITVGAQTFAGAVDGCAPVPGAPGAQLCARLSFTVPQNALAVGSYPLVVHNPGPAACQTAMTLTLQAVPPPTLTAVTPAFLCTGGGTLSLTGQNFRDGAQVLIGGTPAARVTFNSATSLSADFGGGLTVGGPYDVIVKNPDSCQSSLPLQVTITAGPAVLFVDPPVLPAAVSTQVTVYATGVRGSVTEVAISLAGKATYSPLPTTLVPGHANRALATVPAGLAAGTYDVRINDNTTCPAILPGAFKVVTTPTLTVSAVVPPFGSTGLDTAVVISGAGFAGMSGGVPRAYLNPSGNPIGARAQGLAAVTLQSDKSLTGVVRGGLSAGQYDLLVVNSDGNFGLLSKAYTVTSAAAPPPVITSIAPSSVVTAAPTAVTLIGTGFRAPTVSLSCQDTSGAPTGGAAASVTASTGTSISATVTGTGALCLVRVTNSDQTYFDYSAIGVTNASLNLTGFKGGSSLLTARRGLGAGAGRPTAVARFVYAVGGDSGADAAPLDTVEAAPTALDGTLGSFFTLSQRLPAPTSFLGLASVGRYLYAVGGFNGTAAQKTVSRAQLLDPLGAPQVSDVDVVFDPALGLSPGVYVYRVAAVLNLTDPSNPGGETLAGDSFPIQLPAVTGGKLQVVLTWTTIPGAASYRIYRSPKVNAAAGTELLIGTVAAAGPLQFTDNGTVTPAGAGPLPIGSTGAWRPLPNLLTARIGAGVAAVPDPSDATKVYLFAAAGNSGTLAAPVALNTVEVLPITIAADGTQAIGAWTQSAQLLPAARWLGPALAGTSAQNSLIAAGSAYLYVGSGSTGALTALDSAAVYVAQVAAGGALLAFASSGSTGVKRPGYGAALVNNQVMAFGGFLAGGADKSADSASLTSAVKLGNFNSLGGGTLNTARALHGTALESAFIYQLGGASAGPGTAQATTEQTIW